MMIKMSQNLRYLERIGVIMNYKITVNEVKNQQGSLRGFANVVFENRLKITNIAILKNKEDELFVSMPRYKSNERDESKQPVYKDVCNPTTKEFREELYGNVLKAFDDLKTKGTNRIEVEDTRENPEAFSYNTKVNPFEKEGSNIRGLARIYVNDCFVINNVSLLNGKEDKTFVAMPSYKTKQKDDKGKDQYQDIVYPVTKEFRENLYGDIMAKYEQAKVEGRNQSQNQNRNPRADGFLPVGEDTPFR